MKINVLTSLFFISAMQVSEISRISLMFSIPNFHSPYFKIMSNHPSYQREHGFFFMFLSRKNMEFSFDNQSTFTNQHLKMLK